GDPVGEEWSRWDTPGRTVYGGSTAAGAFIEVLEYIRPAPPVIAMTDLFDDVEADDAVTLDEQIAREFPAHGAMPFRSISRGWRQSRRLYEIQLPAEGWFIDVTGANSVATINSEQPELLGALGTEQLTLSELTNSSPEARTLTTGIATWIRESVVLEDGSRPHGITYPSKWGAGLTNWAMWMRRTDDGTGQDPIKTLETAEIGKHSAALIAAAQLRGFSIF
ncbi:RES domain-containing protein, partial [Gordonia hongkongensis]|uniref:RES domain-containing protein n=1 Tax=Gordonia hongkongensis TaxID=1701090 RepID=UPI003EBE13BA